MAPLTTLNLGENEDDPALEESVDPRMKERNKILKVAMTLVALVAGIAPFVNYLTLEMPILGTQEATLADSFSAPTKVEAVDESRIVLADFLNVRKGPGVEYPAMGQVLKGTKISGIGEQRGWLKILTSKGEGWIDGFYVSSPHESKDLWDVLDSLNREGVDPKLAAAFRRLPPYSPLLPAVVMVLVAVSLAFLPFARTSGELGTLRAVIFTWAALAVYALVFHLILIQVFRSALGELSRTTATDLAEGGAIGALAGVATLAFASHIKVHVGPALYLLAAAGVLMSSVSLFLLPLQRRKAIRPFREPGEPVRYLDL